MNRSILPKVNKEKEVISKKNRGFWKTRRPVEAGLGAAVVLVCLLAAGCATPAGPTTAGPGKSPARPNAVKEVAVFVDVEKPSGDSQGINRSQIQNDIETKIQQAGVKVVPQKRPGSTTGVPIIYVNITIAKMEKMYAYNADIIWVNSSPQQALPVRSGKNSMGTSGLVADITQVRQKVSDLVNLFIRDHLS